MRYKVRAVGLECESEHEFETLPFVPNVGDQITINPLAGAGSEIAVVTERRFVYFGQHDRVGCGVDLYCETYRGE